MEMLRYEKNPFPCLLFLLIITFLTPLISINALISPFDMNNDNEAKFSNNNLSKNLKSVNEATDNNAFLPGSNLTVSEYLDGVKQNTFNMTIQTLNFTHLTSRCDYSITQDLEGNPIPSTFYPTIDRTSSAYFYNASNYYGWTGAKQNVIDYWLDTTSFVINSTLEFEGVNLTISSSEFITLAGVGTFEAWKLTGVDPLFGNPMIFHYAKDSGLFLTSQMQYFASIIQYNLTQADLVEISVGYNGSELLYINPENNSINPSGTEIEGEFQSEYGIYSIKFTWDQQSTPEILFSDSFSTMIPEGSGIHSLEVEVCDNLNISRNFLFIFTIDDTLPGINPINVRNGSRIQGNLEILFSVINSNGSLIYNWDGDINHTISSDSPVTIDNGMIEGIKSLNTYVKSPAGIWKSKRYIFTVDNTNPVLVVYNFENNTNIRDHYTIIFSVNEHSITNISINSVVKKSIQAKPDVNYSFDISEDNNGTYYLVFLVIDEAGNSFSSNYNFTIQINSFGWNFYLKANIPKTITIINDNKETMMVLSLGSSEDQWFNLTLLDTYDPPVLGNSLFLIQINCQKSDKIQFTRLVYELPTSIIEVYEWQYFDINLDTWKSLPSIYNTVDNTWESSNEGLIQIFTLISTGETTQLKSVELGGGQIPGFELHIMLFALIVSFFIKKNNRSK